MLTIGIVLGLFFARKFFMSFKVMPAGVMTALRYGVLGRMLTLVRLLSISIQRSLECFKSTHKVRVIHFHGNTFLLSGIGIHFVIVMLIFTLFWSSKLTGFKLIHIIESCFNPIH